MDSVDTEWEEFRPGDPGRFGSLGFADVVSKEHLPPLRLDLRSPFTSRLIPGDSTEAGRRPFETSPVLDALSFWDGTKICAPAVKAVPIDVVAFESIAGRQSEQNAVEAEFFNDAVGALPPPGVPLIAQAPTPLVDPISISGVDQYVGAHAAITGSERDTHCSIRAGIIRVHRVPPVPCATPPAASNSAGVSCVNFTMEEAPREP